MSKFQQIQWVVQRNLTSTSDFTAIQAACTTLNIPFVSLDIIPFTAALPEFDKSRRSIIYGSTTFNALAMKDPLLREGIFFDEHRFSMENYIHQWGQHMLNYDAKISSFKDLIYNTSYPDDKLLFIRPDDDNKAFAGETKRYSEIKDWFGAISQIENNHFSADTKIIISEPYNIQYEWRLWIVNKEVVAASKYRQYFKLTTEAGCPDEVKAFAIDRCATYTPHDVFVMDICRCGDEYYIVECGAMNGAGFYKADIESIVQHVSAYFIYQ